ncbi:MAG TPA: hypothetical protein PK523_05365 [Elusimicrobiales bacterium]|nr:hypothetical protein [Elusimicrobiales bacterium]
MTALLLILSLLTAPAPAQEACSAAAPASDACGAASPQDFFLPKGFPPPPDKPLDVAAAAVPATTAASRSAAAPAAKKPAVPVKKAAAPDGSFALELFYSHDCPHCHDAMKWLAMISPRYPGLRLSKYEIKRDAAGRELFLKRLAERGARPEGVPTFVLDGKVMVGFLKGQTDLELEGEFKRLAGEDCSCRRQNEINIPFLGPVDPASVSLLQFSAVLGLLDGLNPCAMWVLIFLMSLLVYTRSARRMALIGGVFVAVSGLIYFAFMAAWFNIFLVIGYARWITIGLGFIAAVMGLINLKEIFFFKKGVSLMISDSAKPKIAERIRRIMASDKPAVMIAGTALLAVFVNLIELACTIGLPAIFTRVLSLNQASVLEKYYYMAVYNLAYVVPLAVIVTLFVLTMGRYKMTEGHGKILKAISGVLMLLLGALMIFKPEVLTL